MSDHLPDVNVAIADPSQDDHSFLEQLLARAQASAESKTTNKRNKALLKDMAVALVGLAQISASFQGATVRLKRELDALKADKPRIIVP